MQHPTEISPLLPDTPLPPPATTDKAWPSPHSFEAPSSELTGYALIAIATIFISGNLILLRLAVSKFHIPSSTALFLRSVTVLSLGLLTLLRLHLHLPRLTASRTVALLAAAGASNGLGLACLYWAIPSVAVGDASAIHFAFPLITLPLAHIVLGEPLTLFDWAMACLSVSGAVVLSKGAVAVAAPAAHDARVAGVVLAALSAVFTSVGGVLTRSLQSSVHFLHVVLATATGCCVLSVVTGGPMELFQTVGTPWQGVAIVLAGSVLAFAAQSFANAGILQCSAGGASLILNLMVPMTYALGLIFLHEALSFMRALGAVMVVAAASFIGVRQMLRKTDVVRSAVTSPGRGRNWSTRRDDCSEELG